MFDMIKNWKFPLLSMFFPKTEEEDTSVDDTINITHSILDHDFGDFCSYEEIDPYKIKITGNDGADYGWLMVIKYRAWIQSIDYDANGNMGQRVSKWYYQGDVIRMSIPFMNLMKTTGNYRTYNQLSPRQLPVTA